MKASKRRGAVKVPNVILRPAQASSSRSTARHTSLPRVGLNEDDASDGEGVEVTAGNKPFNGIVLCATGNLDKRTLFSYAQALGAVRSNDFTDQVTHLVADAPGSAKYKCALERNLPIMKVTWVKEAYETWLNGGIVDLEQTMRDHRLPIFSGVKLCITGMEDINSRNKIHALLAKEDGVYAKSLDATVTHLLCRVSDSSAKMQWACNYNQTQSQSNQISIVWEEWFWDSIEFRGRWDESGYDVAKARPARKTLSQIPEISESSSTVLPTATLSQREPLPPSIPISALIGDDPPEYGKTKKQRDLGLRILKNIVQMRNNAKSDSAPQCSKTDDIDIGPERIPSLEQESRPSDSFPAANDDSNSVLTRLSFHRATSFARPSAPQPHSRQPFQRIISSSSHLPVIPAKSTRSRLFSGYKIRALGDARGSSLREALQEQGARWLTDDDDDSADFLIVRLVSGGLLWREEENENERAKYRTDCWVERCLHVERICAPDEHIAFSPLQVITPVEGSEDLRISLSGLDPAETCWTKRLVRAVGGNLPSAFSRRTTHLICPSGRGEKYDKAGEWGISVVGMAWLHNLVTTGKIPQTGKFDIHGVDEDVPMSVDDDVDHWIDFKGKGRASTTEEGSMTIIDITNGASLDSQSTRRGAVAVECMQSTTDPMYSTPGSRVVDSGPDSIRRTSALLSVTSPKSPRTALKPGAPSPPHIGSSSWSPTITPERTRSTRLTAAEVEQDKQITRIPSSHSPSPLRIVPVKFTSPPISETASLRTAITALLGKRSTETREEVERSQRLPSRSSKRPRPPSKVKTNLEPGRGLSPTLSFATGSPPLSAPSPCEGGDVFSEERQSSLRVIYEDPGQRAEKKKLIALFDGPGNGNAGMEHDLARADRGGGTAPKKRLVRRSTRSTRV